MNEDAKIALLPDRGVIRLTGQEATDFLQGIITNDMSLLDNQNAIHAALLSPQGKVLFAFFVIRQPNGFLLETDRAKAGDLVQRLKMYQLRAKLEITDVSAEYTCATYWTPHQATSDKPPVFDAAKGMISFPDPRLPELGLRILVSLTNDWVTGESGARPTPHEEYHAHRVSLGVPEAGRDYELGDVFPHEALFDQLAGVCFKKGCFIGQEVVSRMQHRTTVRKRIVPVTATGPLPPTGAPVMAGEATIGKLGTTSKGRALAMIRLDRAAEAIAAGTPLASDGATLKIEIPPWATFTLPE